MSPVALSVFTRTPDSKNAKTRLRGKELADSSIQDLHRSLVKHTLRNAAEIAAVKRYAFWLPAPNDKLIQEYPNFIHQQQTGASFSERFENMLLNLSDKHDAALIVGSDCPFICHAHYDQARAALANGQAAYGPDQRGGLYFMALPLPCRVNWQQLFNSHEQAMEFEGLFPGAQRLPTEHDIDLPEDLEFLLASEKPEFSMLQRQDP